MTGWFLCQVAIVGFRDGDTAYAVLDQGNNLYRGRRMVVTTRPGMASQVGLLPLRHRIKGIQAPEPEAARQLAAVVSDAARDLCPPGIYQTETWQDPDAFGRPLIDPLLPSGVTLGRALLDLGLVEVYRRG